VEKLMLNAPFCWLRTGKSVKISSKSHRRCNYWLVYYAELLQDPIHVYKVQSTP